jgi:DNA-binding response OmpR family regulator
VTAILIVDDSQTVRTDLSEALEASGFRTITCATLAEARTALRTQPISLALLDSKLPDGSGIELLELIRRDHVLGEIPVLVLAAYSEVSDDVIARRVAANDYVAKPYDVVKVVASVRTILGAPPAPDVVLVIDGDATYRAELVEHFIRAGFVTRAAETGGEGLELAASIRPSAIVVDAGMTDMDGPSVVRRLRLEPGLRATPCLMLSDTSSKEAEVRALESGCDGSIKKDDIAMIVLRMRALLRSASVMPSEKKKLVPKRILVVDDDPEYLDLLGVRLRKRGYDVSCAGSGEDAISLLDVQPVDCILLDRSMAGLGGVETCRVVKAKPTLRDIPLIIITATEQREAVIEGLAAGADDFVSKASGFDVLSARVQAQIRRKQIEDEQRRVREALLRSELEASEARAARELAETRAAMAEELTRTNAELALANRELEAFSYAVSHDLRAPLRTVSAYTHAIADNLNGNVDGRVRDHVQRVLTATSRMADRIDALLELSRINREPLVRHRVELSTIADAVVEELRRRDPNRNAEVSIAPDMIVAGDARLMRILLDNLVGTAWKRDAPHIEIGKQSVDGETVFYICDGAGTTPQTDIALTTARRIVERHGGRIWSEGAAKGTKLFFTIPNGQAALG